MSRGIVEIQTPYLDPETALRLLPATVDGESQTIPSMPLPTSEPAPSQPELAIDRSSSYNRDDFAGRMVEMFDAGESITAISKKIFGYKNRDKLEQIKQVLAEYGRIG
jgi:hypothetical protein